MKKGLAAAVFSSALGLLAFAAPAQAQLYWRLDLGWSTANDVNFKDNDFASNGVICGDPICTQPGQVKEVGQSSVVGGGIGYKYGDSVRADITLAVRGGYSIKGNDGAGKAFKADIVSYAAMGNVYYDFSPSAGSKVAPYLGLGAGWAENKMDPVVQEIPGGTLATPAGKKGNFAWSAMAGISVPISGMYFDMSYRFTNLGKIVSDAGQAEVRSTVSGTFNFPYAGAEGKLTAHEIVFGIRF